MPHERSALIDQLRELLTQQRYSSVVIHNYCRSARHFLAYLAGGRLPWIRQSRTTYPATFASSGGSSVSVTVTHPRRGGNRSPEQESTHYCGLCRNRGRLSNRLPVRLKPFAARYATSTGNGCKCSGVSRKRPSAR
jgi:hypothetical protein